MDAAAVDDTVYPAVSLAVSFYFTDPPYEFVLFGKQISDLVLDEREYVCHRWWPPSVTVQSLCRMDIKRKALLSSLLIWQRRVM